jgi:hypothetical protein
MARGIGGYRGGYRSGGSGGGSSTWILIFFVIVIFAMYIYTGMDDSVSGGGKPGDGPFINPLSRTDPYTHSVSGYDPKFIKPF